MSWAPGQIEYETFRFPQISLRPVYTSATNCPFLAVPNMKYQLAKHLFTFGWSTPHAIMINISTSAFIFTLEIVCLADITNNEFVNGHLLYRYCKFYIFSSMRTIYRCGTKLVVTRECVVVFLLCIAILIS